jgi:hypothetical protein
MRTNVYVSIVFLNFAILPLFAEDDFIKQASDVIGAKAEIMQKSNDALSKKTDTTTYTALVQKLTEEMTEFRAKQEMPFEKKYASKLRDNPDLKDVMGKHKETIIQFIQNLQKLKYDKDNAKNKKLQDVMRVFEESTARIPQPNPGP